MQVHSSLASRPVWRPTLLLVLLLGSLAGVGCGQKGPLTLPQAPAGAASAPTK